MNRKLFLLIIVLLTAKTTLFAAVEEKPTRFSGARVPVTDLETIWGLGVGENINPKGEKSDTLLYIDIETRPKGTVGSMPLWNLKIYLQTQEAKSFLPIFFRDSLPMILGVIADVGLVAMMAPLISTSSLGYKVIGTASLGPLFASSYLPLISALHVTSAASATSFLAVSSVLGTETLMTMGALAATAGPSAAVMMASSALAATPVGFLVAGGFLLRKTLDSLGDTEGKRCRAVMEYTIYDDGIKKEETDLLEAIGLKINGESEASVYIKPFEIPQIQQKSAETEWSSVIPLSNDPYLIFSHKLETPIVHMIDVYTRLLPLMTRSSAGGKIPLSFSVKGMSNNPSKYIRNWNSFAVLASQRCCGLPLSLDPRLEEYVHDEVLRERWSKREDPTYDKVIERLLLATKKITERNSGFKVHKSRIEYFARKLDGWFSESKLTKLLREV